MQPQASSALTAPRLSTTVANDPRPGKVISFRSPVPADAARIAALIADCPPLDTNSVYCNLLQCSDFADTCIVAERSGTIVGWISGYRPPAKQDKFFVWQVAVSDSARGEGLGGQMLDALLERPALQGVLSLTTTITEDNAASWALFESFAGRHGATLRRTPRFERDRHFGGAHETEWEARIGPLPTAYRKLSKTRELI